MGDRVGLGCDRPIAGFFDSGSLRSPPSKNPAMGPTLKPTCCQTIYLRKTALKNTCKVKRQAGNLFQSQAISLDYLIM